MKPFTIHRGKLATLNRSNVDTDQIIPKQFLKSIRRDGYGPSAFFDWRYDSSGEPLPGFELNAPRFKGRSILVTRNNFGCGSSREHAVWALLQDGYRVIIAPRKKAGDSRTPAFADIFKSNAVKNGLLTIELSEQEVDHLFRLVKENEGIDATVDLPTQQVIIHAPNEETLSFEMDAGSKERLVEGMDDISISLTYETDIAKFETTHESFLDG